MPRNCIVFSVLFTALSPSYLAGMMSLFSYLAHSSELLHLTFWFLLDHGIQRITGVFVVSTCVFALLVFQATCTAARDGSLYMALRVVGGHVIATLVARRTLFLPCLDDIGFFLTHAGSLADGRFAATLPAVGSALYAFRGGDLVSPYPVCCVAVCLVCTCLIVWIVFGAVFCYVNHCCCPGS